MKKIVVSDYDDTFYVNEEDLKRNKEAVKKFREKENLFVIATGRSYLGIKEEIKKYNIEYDYLIINHGATILGKNDTILYNFPLKEEIILNLKKDLEIENQNTNDSDNNLEKEKNVYFCYSELANFVDFESKNITKIGIRYASSSDASRINKKLNATYKEINAYQVSKNEIEIISKKTDKSKAIQLLADYYSLEKACIVTIGNGYNDIKMIKDYNGYAMQKSVPEIIEVAKEKVKSVAELINKII